MEKTAGNFAASPVQYKSKVELTSVPSMDSTYITVVQGKYTIVTRTLVLCAC